MSCIGLLLNACVLRKIKCCLFFELLLTPFILFDFKVKFKLTGKLFEADSKNPDQCHFSEKPPGRPDRRQKRGHVRVNPDVW
jgi:hypothetical protein